VKKRAKVLVFGRVQGVYFRRFTQNKAKQIGVVGTVKNLPDGSVEIIAQAHSPVFEAFIAWCNKGPITASVERTEVVELVPDEALVTFDIV
jgi:acylphosphatase